MKYKSNIEELERFYNNENINIDSIKQQVLKDQYQQIINRLQCFRSFNENKEKYKLLLYLLLLLFIILL